MYRRDLNLLIALQVLLQENSVSKAAIRLNLSQSAMSRVLARLRQLLDDPLFIRQGAQLIPTERAISLGAALEQPLQNMGQLLTQQGFDPARCTTHFTLATTDYAMQTVLPFALPRIYREAPHIALEFVPLQHDNLLAQLTSEGCDMAICRPTAASAPLIHETLGLVGVSCLVSHHHPLANSELSIDDYLAYPHAMIAISDGVKQLLDNALEAYPPKKQILRAYHLESALAIVDTLPLIITVPADLAYLVAERHQLVIKPLPFEFKPFQYSLAWHPRSEHAAPQQWLRQVIQQECGHLMDSRIRTMGLG
nr:LysR family transcriptional regulator [Shewanella sp. NIFS-20-20]